MKLTGQNAVKYCIEPNPVPALLLHGEPNLKIKDKYKHIKSKLVGNNANDEMRLTEITAAELRKNKSLATDAIKAIGFYLAQNLRFALNDFGNKKRLNLITEIEISENKYSFSSSNKETRMDLIGLIHCKIIDNDHEYKFTVKEMVSYDVSDSIVANKALEKNAKKRLASLLSQAVLTDLYHANFDWIK